MTEEKTVKARLKVYPVNGEVVERDIDVPADLQEELSGRGFIIAALAAPWGEKGDGAWRQTEWVETGSPSP